MHDGNLGALGFGASLELGHVDAVSEDGRILLRTAEDGTAEAQTVVPVGSRDVGRRVAYARLGGSAGSVLIVGFLQMPTAAAPPAQVIEAEAQLVLRCGPASITLFADGRVEIRGVQILSRAEGAQRLQGASIQLN